MKYLSSFLNLNEFISKKVLDINEYFRSEMVGGDSSIEHLPPVEDDPQRRRPDITLAKQVLNWEPSVPLQ